MANHTLEQFNAIREDLSDYLFHFTKGNDAELVLEKILYEETIKDKNSKGYICFTEAPLNMLKPYFDYVKSHFATPTILAPYGIGIKRDVLFKLGARPVIYGKKSEKKLFCPNLHWRFVDIDLPLSDWLWLREWRINTPEVKLADLDIIIVTEKQEEQLLFYDVVIDNPDDEPLDESFVDFKRRYKGIGIDDLLKMKTKQDVKTLLFNQESEILGEYE